MMRNRDRATPVGIWIWTAMLTAACLWLTSQAFAEVPHLVRYQGQAMDSKDVPLEGPYNLTFRLHDAETGGNKLWEEKQDAVQLAGGHFSVLLGQVKPLASMDWSQPCWLSIQVNGEPELAPRQRITSVPLAIRAERAEQLTQAITPALITPQGSGSGLDADTVDGKHAADLLSRANHTGTQPSSTITGTFGPSVISPQGSGSGLDADLLDGKSSSQFATNPHTHQCTTRMSLPGGQTGTGFCSQFSEWCVSGIGGNGQSIHSCANANPGFGDWGAICCR
jgi:hypothetical protein